jgi:hypothetical protein
MNTKTRRTWVRLAQAAAGMLLVGWGCLSPAPASAQLGRLVVTMTAPASGSTVTGTTTVSASVTVVGALTVTGVQFRLDGANLGAQDTAAPYSIAWDTRTTANGPHTLTAVARDMLGVEYTSDAVTVTVFNDTTPPSVALTAPSSGATVSGIVVVSASASDNVGVTGVRFFADGAPIGAEDTSAPYTVSWSTSAVANGAHTLTAVARDAAGNTRTSEPVTVTVLNDSTPPTVGITAPAGGATVGGTVAVSAAAVDNIGVAGVRFLADGAPIGAEDTSAPYTVSWDTSPVANGSHTLTAIARDTAGNTTTSEPVTVTVFNDTTPPTVAITAPAAGATVTGTVTVSASASDNGTVAGVQFFVDGAPIGAEDASEPYAVAWDTTAVTDGSHTLTAVARDGGNRTTTSAPVTVTVSHPVVSQVSTRLENTETSISYTDGVTAPGQPAGWWHGSRSRAWSGVTASFNRSAGARATLTFTGTSIRWIGFRAPWAGIARVFVDSAFVEEIDLYSPTEAPQAVVFTASGLAAGASHTLAVEVTGRKNASASDFAVVVDAFDVSPGSPLPAAGTRFEETASAVSYAGSWASDDTGAAWSGGTAAVSAAAGARATFTFAGTAVTWIGLRGPQSGIARVFLDGALQAEIDTYSPVEIQAAVFAATNLAAARHTVTIEATGLRNAAASDARIVVDAFDVRARFEDVDSSVAHTGDWRRENTDRAWSGTSANAGSGTAALTRTAGARTTFAFAGPSVSWIGLRGPFTGIARVFLDDVFVADVDTFAAAEELQAVVFSATGLPDTPHTLAIEVTGLKNPASIDPWIVVDAFDVTVSPGAPAVTRVQEREPSVGFTTGWTHGTRLNLWSGEFAAFSATAGERATFTFTGTAVRWIGQRAFSGGIARVFLDGMQVAEIDTYAPLQEEFQAAMFTASGLPNATHTLMIEVTGLQNPASQGAFVVVDAFDVY